MSSLKDLEFKAHDELYQNVLLLTHIYPTTRDFNEIFCNDMFAKNNKAAFHQVMYYLLNILNPELTKKKIMSWPIYDIKIETKFRSEVLEVINELNLLYEDANIPTMMASQLISPGGFKFVKFMMKLSQLVLLQHFKRKNGGKLDVGAPIKACKNVEVTKKIIGNLKIRTAQIELETKGKLADFYNFYNKSKNTSEAIIQDQTKLNSELAVIKADLKTQTSQANAENFAEILECVNAKVTQLETTSVGLKKLTNISKDCEELLSFLNGSDCVLELENPNLTRFFEATNMLLDQKSLNMIDLSPEELNKIREVYAELNTKYSLFDNQLMANRQKLQEDFMRFETKFEAISKTTKANEKDETLLGIKPFELSDADEVLAVPLKDTSLLL